MSVLKMFLPLGCMLLFYKDGYMLVLVSMMFFYCFLTSYLMGSLYSVYSCFMLDVLSFSMVLLSFWIGGLMMMASLNVNAWNNMVLQFLIVSLIFILVVTFSVSSLVLFYIFFEASLVPITVMVLGWGYQPERVQASNYLVLYTVMASLPFLVSILCMCQEVGHSSFLLFGWGGIYFYSVSVWWLVTVGAFLVKTPLYFFHLWLPKAHVEAPVAGSMILAGVLLKLGGYGMMRLLMLFQAVSMGVSFGLCVVAIWGGVICAFICLRQVDVKALIAYSSVTHMGVMVGGLMSNTVWGWQGALMMMLSHGLVSSSLFLGAYLMYKIFSTRNLFMVKGMMSVVPLMSLLWFFALGANMGVPPSINLQGELMLVASVTSMSSLFMIPLFFSLFFSAVYSLLLYSSSQNGHFFWGVVPLFTLSNTDVMCMFSHLLPVYLLVVKGGSLVSWVS